MTVAVMKRFDAQMIANDQWQRFLELEEDLYVMNKKQYDLQIQQEELRMKQFQPPYPGYVDTHKASTEVMSIPSQHMRPFVDPTVPRF